MDEIEFVAPGKGPWELETAHFSRPLTRFSGPAYIAALPKGFAQGTARYGLLLDHLRPALVNGFGYIQPVAYLAPQGAMGPPPKPVLWLLTRLHPKMRARIATSARAFETKQWRQDLELWDTKDKPAAIEQHLAIQMIDVGALSDEALVGHLETCHAHFAKMTELHHKYTATSIVVTGDFLATAMEVSGASASEVCNLLKGSSPISNGFAAEELIKAGEAIAANADAEALLRSLVRLPRSSRRCPKTLTSVPPFAATSTPCDTGRSATTWAMRRQVRCRTFWSGRSSRLPKAPGPRPRRAHPWMRFARRFPQSISRTTTSVSPRPGC